VVAQAHHAVEQQAHPQLVRARLGSGDADSAVGRRARRARRARRVRRVRLAQPSRLADEGGPLGAERREREAEVRDVQREPVGEAELQLGIELRQARVQGVERRLEQRRHA
jgi:hypothetical protein